MTQLNVLLATLGSAGDVNPFVAIGRALLDRGHRVTLITSAHFQDIVAKAGLGFFGLGTRDDYAQVVDDPDLWDPSRGFQVFARRVVIPAIRPVYDIVASNLRPNTVVVAQGQAFGAHLAHERLAVPFVTINLQPVAFRSAHDSALIPPWIPLVARPSLFRLIDFLVLDRELANPVNALRGELGLAPVKHVFGSWAHSPQKTIGLFPEWFAPPQVDWPPNTKQAGFVLTSEDTPPQHSGLARFLDSGPPPIVFTPGTEMKHAQGFFAASIRALTHLGHRGILLSRHTQHIPSPLPEGVVSFPYISFASVLPRAAAIVHHGGIGTIAQSFAAGIPQVIRPMAHDQPDTAARVQRLGVGLTVSPRHYTPDRVHSALRDLLASQPIREACRLYSTKVNSAEALTVVCDEIEAVASRYAAYR